VSVRDHATRLENILAAAVLALGLCAATAMLDHALDQLVTWGSR
jgi:hypothetical protein